MFSRVVRSSVSRMIMARQKWSDKVKDGNVNGIIECYAKNHSFKGTLNNHVTNTESALQEYFIRLGKKKPVVIFTDSKIEKNGEIYVDKGKYSFMLEGGEIMMAKYTMEYKEIDGKVKIISHYSYLLK